MKVLTFLPYEMGSKDEEGRAPIHARAFTVALLASGNLPSGPSAKDTARVVRVFEKIQKLSVKDKEGRRLNPQGGQLLLEHEELETLKAAIDKIRENVPAAQGDSVVFLDELIASAPEEAKDLH